MGNKASASRVTTLTAAPSGKPVCAIGGGSGNLNPRSLKILPRVNAVMSA